MMLQLDPPIPMKTPKGEGMAHFVTNLGQEHSLVWTVIIDETGEIWDFQNPFVRAQKNITLGRFDVENPRDLLKTSGD